MCRKRDLLRGVKKMKIFMYFVLFFLITVACHVSGGTEEKVKHHSAVVALVNGEPILFGEVWKHVRRVLEYARSEWSGPDEQFVIYMHKQLLMVRGELVKDALLLKKVKEEKIEVSESQVERWAENEIEYLNKRGKNITSMKDYWRVMEETTGLSEKEYRAQMAKEVKIQQLIRQVVWNSEYFSPRLVRNYYKQNQEKFRTVGYVTIRHIYISKNQKNFEEVIGGISAELARGDGFEQIARRTVDNGYSYRTGDDGAGSYTFSVGKVSGDDSGKKKCRGAIEEQLLPVLQKEVERLKVGQVSGMIRMFSGTHIIKVVSREFGRTKPFAEVQTLIQMDLRRKFREKAEYKYLKKLMEKAEVKLFPFPRVTPLGVLTERQAKETSPEKSSPEAKDNVSEETAPEAKDNVSEESSPEAKDNVSEETPPEAKR